MVHFALFIFFQADFKDAGNYSLIVSSSVFHEDSSVSFQIVVVSNEVDPPVTSIPNSVCLPNVTLIILLVIFVLITILLIAVIIVMFKRSNNAAGKTLKNNSPVKHIK